MKSNPHQESQGSSDANSESYVTAEQGHLARPLFLSDTFHQLVGEVFREFHLFGTLIQLFHDDAQCLIFVMYVCFHCFQG